MVTLYDKNGHSTNLSQAVSSSESVSVLVTTVSHDSQVVRCSILEHSCNTDESCAAASFRSCRTVSTCLSTPDEPYLKCHRIGWFTLFSYAFIHGNTFSARCTIFCIELYVHYPGIIAIRIWALYGRQRWLLVILVAASILYFIATSTLLGFAAAFMLRKGIRATILPSK